MSFQEQLLQQEFLQINAPRSNYPADVAANLLCECSGRSVPPDASYQCRGVKIWGTRADGVFLDPAIYPTEYVEADISAADENGAIDWSSPYVQSFSEAAPTQNNSKVLVAALFEDDSQPPQSWCDPPLGFFFPTRFKGVAVAFCGAHAAPPQNLISAPVRPPHLDAVPSGFEDGFLRFDRLQPAESANTRKGYRLTSHGAPLRAKHIRVAAHRVRYYFKTPDPVYVHRPAGPTIAPPIEPERLSFEFGSLPIWSIVIHQAIPYSSFTLFSDNQLHADLVHLDPNHDIYVQVNYKSGYRDSLGGSFGLLVDPID